MKVLGSILRHRVDRAAWGKPHDVGSPRRPDGARFPVEKSGWLHANNAHVKLDCDEPRFRSLVSPLKLFDALAAKQTGRAMRKALAIAIFLSATVQAEAQAPASPFADPENLKVLPEDISPEDLRDVMKGFSFATGFRCDDCHVAKENAPLSEWDFAADNKERKRIARAMLHMVKDINHTIDDIDGIDAEGRVEVRCMTCHRGVKEPALIQDILDGYKAEGDAEGAIKHYSELRDIYYGSHSYDFSPIALGRYAEDASREGATDFALALHALNRELNADDDFPYAAWGNTLSLMEDLEGALEAYRLAAERAPENTQYKKQIERLEEALAAQ